MDLRLNIETTEQINQAANVLNYQPFILSDDLQTGVAYSWQYAKDPRVSPPLVFRRKDYLEQEWISVSQSNARLRSMYEDLLDEVSARFTGGSLLDVACNNGYFPVGAELRGMRGVGMDLGDYSAAVATLNTILGTRAKFLHRHYDSITHVLPIGEQFDVVVASAIMCHLPDPLHFLAALGKIAHKAILFWGQMVDTDELLVAYSPPHANLSSLTEFPVCFNDNTRISRGLFEQSMKLMGFREIIEIPPRDTWVLGLHESRGIPLDQEIKTGSRHVALLAMR